MKKEQSKELYQLRNELEPLMEKIETPEALSAQGVTDLLEAKQPKQKKGKVIALNTVRVLAAVLAVAIGVGAAMHFYNRPRVEQIPKEIASAESPLASSSQKQIVDYFTALRAQYKENRRKGVDTDVCYETAEEAVAFNDGAKSAEPAATGAGTTNTQVENVDEQDVIENDGRYLYYVTNDQAVHIVDTGTMKQVSRIAAFNNSAYNSELYYSKDKLVVLNSAFDGEKPSTVIRVFDVTDRVAPKLLKTVEQDGGLLNSRLVGGRLVVLSNDSVPLYSLKTKGGYVKYEDVAPGTKVDGGKEQPLDASCITIMPDSESSSYLVITALDLDTLAESKPHTSAILGAGETIYCTEERLFVAACHYQDEGNYGARAPFAKTNTQLYAFSFWGEAVKLEHTGSVPGTLNNSFSLDYTDGTLRVATTGTNKKGAYVNRIAVLDDELKEIGHIDGIAPNETIRSVRYIGQYGYVVTFEQTDPLFAIDFSDPTNPKIVSELKMPGYSGYLHPFNGYLIGVGVDGDENGAGDGVKVSLFDVSDPAAPKEIDKIVIPQAETPVGANHHFFTDNRAQNRFGFVYEYAPYFYERRFCTFAVKDGKLELLATFSNNKSFDVNDRSYTIGKPDGSADVMIYQPEEGVERGTYIGSTLYTASPNRICAWPFDGGECEGIAELN